MRSLLLASVRLARRHRRVATLALYAVITVSSYRCAYLLRFGSDIPSQYIAVLAPTLLVLLLLRLANLLIFRLDRVTWRFAGTGEILRLGAATAAATVTFLAMSEVGLFGTHIPRLIIILEAGVSANLTAACWLYYRVTYEFERAHRGTRKRTLIVGAGEEGHLLAHEIRRSPLGYQLLGFVDDDPHIRHMEVCGTEVLGTTAELSRIAAETDADELLISPVWRDQKSFRETIATCQRTGLPMKVLPAFADVVRGDGLLGRLREVTVEDLLGRAPVQLALPELALEFAERSVLITGAAGSIGSELARQIALHHPATLVLFDHDETQLFYTEMELRERYPDVLVVPIVGDVTNTHAVERVYRAYTPQRVYHAAAYKHVPMMESNACEAIRNNLIGTRVLAEISGAYGVEKFVLMSTDKAVRPCSVMGATKRLAELAVLDLQQVYPDTSFFGVRFGNVLGSRGSVLPIFERQLRAGQPLTVTHPEMTRYFMTIPEAVQLILQASLLPQIRGQLAMLEMGEPVHILELAHNFLRLAGRAHDNRIIFTGPRRGERLHEELVAPDEVILDSSIAKVKLVITPRTARGEMARLIGHWAQLLDADDEAGVLRELRHRFPSLRLPPGVAEHAHSPLGGGARHAIAAGSSAFAQPDPEVS